MLKLVCWSLSVIAASKCDKFVRWIEICKTFFARQTAIAKLIWNVFWTSMKLQIFWLCQPWPQNCQVSIYEWMKLSSNNHSRISECCKVIMVQTFEYSVLIKLQIFSDVDPDFGSFNWFVICMQLMFSANHLMTCMLICEVVKIWSDLFQFP